MAETAGETQSWKRLGELLIQRRVGLDPSRYRSRQAFCEDTGLDYRLIYDAEQAKRTNFGVATLAALEQAYQLKPGAIREALAGAPLAHAAAPQAQPPQRVDPAVFADPADPVEEWLLHPPASLGVTPEEISALIVTHRVLAQREGVFAPGFDREMRELRRRRA